MINEENLNKMYEGILNNQELTTKELNSYGFNSKDLADLIESGTLERIRRGYYSFKSIDNLFYYGKKLISMKEYDKATACFEKCYELDSNHSGACFELFLRCIQNGNYEKSLEYFDNIYPTHNRSYDADSNYYLYLLSMIIELPENRRQYVKLLKLKDIFNFNDKRYNDNYTRSKIRLSSLNQKFLLALTQLDDLIKQNGKLSPQDMITQILLFQAKKKQKENKNRITELINEKQYEKVIEFLGNIKKQHNLSLSDEYTFMLTKDLIEIIKTGIIPEKQIFSTDKLFDAIDAKNYELALSISTEHIKENKIDGDNNPIYILLTEIQNLIDKKKNISTSVAKKQIQEIKPVKVEQEEQIIESKTTISSSSCSNSFADIIGYLMKNDLDNSFRVLRNYLDSIGKREYEFLIIDLIKISLLENDIAFTKPMTVLTYVARENFEFNISEYIQNFYETLAQNKLDQARVYLDIISKSNNLGICIFTKDFEFILNSAEKELNYKSNNEILNRVEESIQNVENNLVSTNTELSFIEQTSFDTSEIIFNQSSNIEMPIQKKEQSINKPEMSQSKGKDYDYNEFINQKLETIYKKGIILLKPMNSEQIKKINDIVKNIPDIVSFCIGKDNSRQIVLRFKPDINEKFDLKELLRAGNEAYKNGDYNACISAFKQCLTLEEPKSFVYAKLGLAYTKKFDKNTAIDYLTVATELSKNDNQAFDFTELIERLKFSTPNDARKTYVKMSTADFENDVNNYYGIEEVVQVAELVSSGVSINDACLNLGLNEEQKNTIILIFAKNCYAQENYAIGDSYLKMIEKVKNKSEFICSLFDEVRKNKKFYKNRIDENSKQLVLTKIQNSENK